MQKTDEPKSVAAPDNLFSSDTGDTRIEGDFDGARGTSVATWLETHPSLRTGVGLGRGAGVGGVGLATEVGVAVLRYRLSNPTVDFFKPM